MRTHLQIWTWCLTSWKQWFIDLYVCITISLFFFFSQVVIHGTWCALRSSHPLALAHTIQSHTSTSEWTPPGHQFARDVSSLTFQRRKTALHWFSSKNIQEFWKVYILLLYWPANRLYWRKKFARETLVVGLWGTHTKHFCKTLNDKSGGSSIVNGSFSIMKDNGYPMPPWELPSPTGPPPILTFSELDLEGVSLVSPTEPQNDTYPAGLGQPIGQTCSPEGQWNCMTTSYQRCASGMWSVAFPCAAGTICQPFGLTDYITIEYQATANSGQTEDGGDGSNNERSGRRSSAFRNTPGLVLLFAAFAAGVSWGFLGWMYVGYTGYEINQVK